MSAKDVESLVKSAMKKVGAKKENDLCHFVPGESGGYIHHFTLRKIRTENEAEFVKMLEQYIINPATPKKLPPKPRAARGSRKRRDQLLFSKQDIDRLLNMARLAGDTDIIRKLSPKRDLRVIKRELISSIRHGRVEQDLWDAYTDTITAQNAPATPEQVATAGKN